MDIGYELLVNTGADQYSERKDKVTFEHFDISTFRHFDVWRFGGLDVWTFGRLEKRQVFSIYWFIFVVKRNSGATGSDWSPTGSYPHQVITYQRCHVDSWLL